MERHEDRLGTEVGHKRKEQRFDWSDSSLIFTHIPFSHGHATGLSPCLLQLRKQSSLKKRLFWQKVTWRSPRRNCRASFSRRSSRQTPSRSCRGSFRSCRRSPWWPKRSLYPTGTTGSAPERGPVPCELVRRLGGCPGARYQTPRGWLAVTDTDTKVRPPAVAILL